MTTITIKLWNGISSTIQDTPASIGMLIDVLWQKAIPFELTPHYYAEGRKLDCLTFLTINREVLR